MSCYRKGGCGPYEYYSCYECPASKPEYAKRYEVTPMDSMSNKKRPIDANELIRKHGSDVTNWDNPCAVFISSIENAPTMDVVEVVHGHWVYDHWCEFKCSICGEFSNSKPYKGHENYCPNCGAKMDLKSEGKDE